MKGIIDPPSPFGSLAEWQTFLKELKSMKKPDDGDVKRNIKLAEQEIAKRLPAIPVR